MDPQVVEENRQQIQQEDVVEELSRMTTAERK
jgi:hypothetical protein